MTTSVRQMQIGARAVAGFLFVMVLFLAVPFMAAGTLDWPMAWAYVTVYVGSMLVSRLLLLRRNPDLVQERAQYTKAEGAKSWDRAIVPLVALVGPFLSLVVAGLDHRLNWTPPMPPAFMLLALAIVIAGSVFSTWALLTNRFFAAVVRIQADRGQTVISDGAYRFIRHPGYAGGILTYLFTPLVLGSLWALIPAALTAALMVARTALEDRTLHDELPGYVEYAQRTRYRLLPGVW